MEVSRIQIGGQEIFRSNSGDPHRIPTEISSKPNCPSLVLRHDGNEIRDIEGICGQPLGPYEMRVFRANLKPIVKSFTYLNLGSNAHHHTNMCMWLSLAANMQLEGKIFTTTSASIDRTKLHSQAIALKYILAAQNDPFTNAADSVDGPGILGAMAPDDYLQLAAILFKVRIIIVESSLVTTNHTNKTALTSIMRADGDCSCGTYIFVHTSDHWGIGLMTFEY
jgi:hypothetical protein